MGKIKPITFWVEERGTDFPPKGKPVNYRLEKNDDIVYVVWEYKDGTEILMLVGEAVRPKSVPNLDPHIKYWMERD